MNIGLGRVEGTLRFTGGLDPMNHVLRDDEEAADVVDVPVRTFDAEVGDGEPTLIKIDVEGFETEVIAGAEGVLSSPNLLAVVMELNGSGGRYGFDEDALHRTMIDRGFETFRYEPFERRLESLHGARSSNGNTLYVRNAAKLAERVRTAPRFRLGIGAEI